MAIDIKTVASGSSGNCYLVHDGKTKLMLECGISWERIQQAIGFRSRDIAACLVTHEHNDHALAVSKVLERGIDIYTSAGTAAAKGITGHHGCHIVRHNTPIDIGTWTVVPFSVDHDAAEPLGFLLHSRETGEKMIFVTDTYVIRHRFPALDYMLLECNYSYKILADNVEKGNLPKEMVPRLLQSHMALETLKMFLQEQDLSKLKKIFLLHLSDGNSDSQLFHKEILRVVGVPVEVAAKRQV